MVRPAIQSRPCSYSRRPDSNDKGMERGRGYGDGRGWSASFVDTDDEDNRSLAHTGRCFPHWCMTSNSRGCPVSDIMLPKSRHPQFGLSLFNTCRVKAPGERFGEYLGAELLQKE
jgi:hypothetical protein